MHSYQVLRVHFLVPAPDLLKIKKKFDDLKLFKDVTMNIDAARQNY